MAETINAVTFDVGDVVKFKTESAIDPTLWQGKVLAFGNNVMANLTNADIVNYNAEVKKTVTDLQPIETQLFVIMEVENQGSEGAIRAFSTSWIKDETFQAVVVNNTVDIRVYDVPDGETANILTLLRSSGYTVKTI